MSEVEDLMKKAMSFSQTSTEIGDPTKINPAIMTSIMTMASAGQLAKIRKEIEERNSSGWVKSFQLALSDAPFGEGWNIDPPAQSISITNDGPQPALVCVNDPHYPDVVNINEIRDFVFEKHLISRIFLRCQTPGGTAAVRYTLKG
jgi:hypothetical protein